MNKIQCKAIGRDNNQCNLFHESGYCHNHSFMRNLDENSINLIKKS